MTTVADDRWQSAGPLWDGSAVGTASGRAVTDPTGTGRAWLRGAMAALAVLAAAAAVVSWDAQYVMVYSARPKPAIAALEAGIPGRGRAHLRRARHRTGPARPPGAPPTGAERRMRGDLAGDERDGRRGRLAGHGHLGHACRCVCTGQRHPERGPRLGTGPKAGHRAGPCRGRGHAARGRRGMPAVAAALGAGTGQHAGRVSPLGG
jgi:hypothetical protein